MSKNDMNFAICISGGGTTMKAVLDARKDNRLPHANPVLIISSDREAGGIEKAKQAGLCEKNIAVLVRKEFETREAYGDAILGECKTRGADFIIQCGFIPTMPANVVAEYQFALANQHPGPIDQERLGFGGKGMRGLAVHAAVIYFHRHCRRPFRTEASVHRVANKVDGGEILGVTPVRISPRDNAKSLAKRVLPYEHALVIRTILEFSEFGGMQGIRRATPLILPGEEALLEEAKMAGIAAYPNG